MDRVTFDTTTEPGTAIVALTGEHELYGALKLQDQLEEFVADRLDVVLDLTHATFVDSSTVAVFLKTRQLARTADIGFTIVMDEHTGQAVRSMFEITGLTEILPIVAAR